VKFQLPNPLNSSKYVGITDDVENAWMDVAYRKFLPSPLPIQRILSDSCPTVPDQMVSATDFPKLGKPATAMQVTDPKTGERGYRVGIEVFHQLHCLNLLRMATYPEYYTKLWWSDTNDKPERVRGHLGTFPLSFSFALGGCFPAMARRRSSWGLAMSVRVRAS
jgi:hypothetical protein